MDRAELNDVRLLAQFSQVLRTAIDASVDQVGMHRGQAMLLCQVAKQDGMTQSELAQALSVQGATITNLLKRMEDTGMVVRRRDDEDNRLVRVYITDDGRQREVAITEQFEQLIQQMFAGLCDEEYTAFRRTIGQLMSNLETFQIDQDCDS